MAISDFLTNLHKYLKENVFTVLDDTRVSLLEDKLSACFFLLNSNSTFDDFEKSYFFWKTMFIMLLLYYAPWQTYLL